MNWLRKKIINWLDEHRYEPNEQWAIKKSGEVSAPNVDMGEAITFKVLKCRGGVVVQSNLGYGNHAKTSSDSNIFIIAEGDPVAETLASIISMELLRS